MENNLENRPKLDDVYDYDEASRRKALDKLYKMEEWFVGIEKELQEKSTRLSTMDWSEIPTSWDLIEDLLGKSP